MQRTGGVGRYVLDVDPLGFVCLEAAPRLAGRSSVTVGFGSIGGRSSAATADASACSIDAASWA
jgi:hypothetical protein